MPLSESERKQLEKLLAKEKEEEYEPPSEVAFEIGETKVWIPYADAKRFLKKSGIDLDEVLQEEGEGEEGGEEDEEDDEESEGEQEEEVEGELPRIPRKKTAKKSTDPPVVDERTRSQRYFRKSS